MQQTTPMTHHFKKAVNATRKWIKGNSMNINPTKLKEILISFAREKPTVPHVTTDDEDIERVNTCTLLGITLNEYLTWHNHIDKMYNKACQQLHFLLQLKRTTISSDELVQVYVSLIRPILEYGFQLWHVTISKLF